MHTEPTPRPSPEPVVLDPETVHGWTVVQQLAHEARPPRVLGLALAATALACLGVLWAGHAPHAVRPRQVAIQTALQPLVPVLKVQYVQQ